MKTCLRLLLIAAVILVLAYRLASHIHVAAPDPTPVQNDRPYYEVNYNLVRLIYCNTGEQAGLGTGWVIRKNVMVTAAHVAQGGCYDVATRRNLIPIEVDEDNDFALLEMPMKAQKDYIRFSCEGFKTDNRYLAVGYAGGEDLRQTPLRAKDWVTPRLAVADGIRPAVALRFLDGNIYHGMSGGPIFDDHGVAVGINSAEAGEGRAYSRDLRDTSLCGRPRRNS